MKDEVWKRYFTESTLIYHNSSVIFLLQRLFQIGEDVVRVLKSDRQADEAGCNAAFCLLFGRKL